MHALALVRRDGQALGLRSLLMFKSVSLFLCLQVVGVVEIIKMYLVQLGCFLAATGYVAPSPDHVQYNVSEIRMYLTVATLQIVFVCLHLQVQHY